MKILESVKNFYLNIKTKNKNCTKEDFYEYTRPEEIANESYQIDIPEVQITQNIHDLQNPGILLMDDVRGMTTLIENELSRVQCCEVTKEFSIAISSGDFAAFSVKRFLEDSENEFSINIALLDITLGGVINGIEYDGIDVAIMIKEKFPDALIKFITGHTLNRRNPEIFKFIEKFETHFNVEIDETQDVIIDGEIQKIYKHVIRKNANRVFELGLTIEEYLDNNPTIVHRIKKFNKIGNSRIYKSNNRTYDDN